MRRLLSPPSWVIVFSLILLAPISATLGADFKREVVYQIITDRFFDGSNANNTVAGGCEASEISFEQRLTQSFFQFFN